MTKKLMAICTLLTLLLIICVTACKEASVRPILNASNQDHTYQVNERLKRAYDSTVSLMGLSDSSIVVVATGVVIKNAAGYPVLVLTADHAIRSLQKRQGEHSPVLVGNKRTKEVFFTFIAKQDEKLDLALLRGIVSVEKDGPAAILSSTEPRLGEFVWCIGSHSGLERNISRGILSNIVIEKGISYYRTDANLYFGNSGGGMFNKKNELIGIIHAMVFNETFVIPQLVPGSTIAVSLPHIRKFLAGVQ